MWRDLPVRGGRPRRAEDWARQASPTGHLSQQLRKDRRERIVTAARSRSGKLYAYGAGGPNAFDCSRLTQWVLRAVAKRLARTSEAQVVAVRHVRHPHEGRRRSALAAGAELS